MSKSAHYRARGTGAMAASTTGYRSLGPTGGYSGTSSSAVESVQQSKLRTDGVISRFYMFVTNNDRGASTARVRINGANGSGILSIGASTTGHFVDASNTDAVAAGDLIAASVVTGAGGTTFVDRMMGCLFDPTTGGNCVTFMGCCDGGSTNISTNSLTGYVQPMGAAQWNTTESRAQFKMRGTGTLANMAVQIPTNTRITSCTFASRKNTAAGGMSLSVGAGLTGQFEDTTHTDALVSGDLLCVQFVTSTGGGTLTLSSIKTEFTSTDAHFYAACGYAAGRAFTAGTTSYLPISGPCDAVDTTEANLRAQANLDYVADKLQVFITANAATATSTVRTRKNGANGNQSVSIGSTATGFFEDASNTDTLTPTDDCNFQVVVGSGGTMTLSLAGIRGVTSTTNITGTGAITVSSLVLASSGKERMLGSAAINTASLVVAATGVERIIGSAALIESSIVLAASGKERMIGTAALTVSSLALLGAGIERIIGAAVLAASRNILAATGFTPLSAAVATVGGKYAREHAQALKAISEAENASYARQHAQALADIAKAGV